MNTDTARNYIVNENPILVQRKCREFGAATFLKYAVGMLIVSFLLNWIPDILSVYITTSYWDVFASRLNLTEEQMAQLPQIALVAVIYPVLFSGVVQLGKCLYSLTYIRNNKVEYVAIFEGFKLYPKAFLLYIAETAIVMMLSMLLIVPGVIAFYAFSQSFFVLADNPEKGVFECLRDSKTLMFCNKIALFKLQLSYLPVLCIGYIPVLAVSYFADLDYSTLGGTLIGIASEIPLFFAVALLAMGEAVFYELLVQGGFRNFKYAAQDVFRADVA